MKLAMILFFAATLLSSFFCLARAQLPAPIPRIGFLSTGAAGPANEALRQGLRDLGYVDGKDVLIEPRYSEERRERLDELAKELVRLKVDVIVTTSTEPSLSAQRATKTIPIVLGGLGDPVASGLVASLARPGGNITGVTNVSAPLGRKRLELLKEVAPNISVVAVLWIPGSTGNRLQLKEIEAVAPLLGLRVQPIAVTGTRDYESAFAAVSRVGAGALVVLAGSPFSTNRIQIAERAAASRLPAIYPVSEFVDVGGLMSYGTNTGDVYRRVAHYIDRILKGAKPADLPVEAPTTFELVVNLKTARQIGLTIPESILHRVDRLIE